VKILVSGSSGLVGTALVPSLASAGHQAVCLVRREPKPGEAAVRWDPSEGSLDPTRLEGIDGVVHLSGENIAAGRWTTARKELIRSSRVGSTHFLSESLARLDRPPRALICASAIGYYGDRGDETLREESPPGSGFLSDLCQAWEAAAEPAARKGIRVVHLRFGVILSAAGGALAKMLPPFRLGAGGVLGSGRQFMSWITLEDAVGAIQHVLITEALRGPVNVVSPHPVTNREFTKTLGRVLSRPTLLPMPAAMARLLFGEMADALLLSSARVQPARLLAAGYRFRHADLETALRALLPDGPHKG
jgi:uncharacterized protein